MKNCSNCGEENEEQATRCRACGTSLVKEPVDPALTDPAQALRVVATFGDVTEASLVRDKLDQAGIEACIPEELESSPFGGFRPMASVTVRVAQKDYEAARAVIENQA